MGGIALIARELGHEVTGSDAAVYPPMNTLLDSNGISISEGFLSTNLNPRPDLVLIGNALSRGNPEVEAVLSENIPYVSGAQWLAEEVLYKDRWTLVVAGTHGKTTTSSILAWLLEYAGMEPGFLIGGVTNNFDVSARLGRSIYFVIEGDEYDTAFFDKRSKFVHYRPRTLVLNNLEFDHADIFKDLDAIKTQFHHLIRTVPGSGQIVCNNEDENLKNVLDQGCWTPVVQFGEHGAWQAEAQSEDCSRFSVIHKGKAVGQVVWSQIGRFNMTNALAAIVAADQVGVNIEKSLEALGEFSGVKRRMEIRGEVAGVTVYDDFAHHPTAISASINALKSNLGDKRLIAVLEPRSNTMKMGHHTKELIGSVSRADLVYLVSPGSPGSLSWNPEEMVRAMGNKASYMESVDNAVKDLLKVLKTGDHVLCMSNGSFGGIHEKLLKGLAA